MATMTRSAAVSQSQSGNYHGDDDCIEPARELLDFSQIGINPISIAAFTPVAT